MGYHFLLQEDLSKPGTEPMSPALSADPLPFEPPGKPPVRCRYYRAKLKMKACEKMGLANFPSTQAAVYFGDFTW